MAPLSALSFFPTARPDFDLRAFFVVRSRAVQPARGVPAKTVRHGPASGPPHGK